MPFCSQCGNQVTPTDLFAAADRAQYVAKHGRLATTVMAEDFASPAGQRLGDDEAAG